MITSLNLKTTKSSYPEKVFQAKELSLDTVKLVVEYVDLRLENVLFLGDVFEKKEKSSVANHYKTKIKIDKNFWKNIFFRIRNP